LARGAVHVGHQLIAAYEELVELAVERFEPHPANVVFDAMLAHAHQFRALPELLGRARRALDDRGIVAQAKAWAEALTPEQLRAIDLAHANSCRSEAARSFRLSRIDKPIAPGSARCTALYDFCHPGAADDPPPLAKQDLRMVFPPGQPHSVEAIIKRIVNPPPTLARVAQDLRTLSAADDAHPALPAMAEAIEKMSPVSPPATNTAPTAMQRKSRKKRSAGERWRAEMNVKAREHLLEHPDAHQREIADAIGCSKGVVGQLPAVRAVQEQRQLGRTPRTRAVGPAIVHDDQLTKLAEKEEQPETDHTRPRLPAHHSRQP
jgi:hypothetical protein